MAVFTLKFVSSTLSVAGRRGYRRRKQWFNPGYFYLGFESGLFTSFPLFSAADLWAVHDIPGWFYNFLERISGQAILSRSTWTNGGTAECSSYHFMGVDFESIGE
ncbi:hypothetical protein V6N12_027115 [Hibiscus sabdariffa]|uniref:Uncharacterized protein n=1 Tax=Hibiscus sabdariffa TaxID=183260 RepID=A0ABR2DTU4_9ROSI